jgi:hypothetical protein
MKFRSAPKSELVPTMLQNAGSGVKGDLIHCFLASKRVTGNPSGRNFSWRAEIPPLEAVSFGEQRAD